jgi:hypothetical protein
MRVGAAQKLSFDHTRHDQVADILGHAGDFIDTVDAPNRGSDDRKILPVSGQQGTSLDTRLTPSAGR